MVFSHFQPVAKKLAVATGAQDYNILQNNGRAAHQIVDHVRNPRPTPFLFFSAPSFLAVFFSLRGRKKKTVEIILARINVFGEIRDGHR